MTILIFAIIFIVVSILIVYSFFYFRKEQTIAVLDEDSSNDPIPTEESFEMTIDAGGGKLIASGKFAAYVTPGGQYSTWRQFPQAIRFSLLEYPDGKNKELPDHTLSISDTNEVYKKYASMPCGSIVEKKFTLDLLKKYPECFKLPGNYIIEAAYAGLKTKPVRFVLIK